MINQRPVDLHRLCRASVTAGTALAVAGFAHSLLNARLLRQPGPMSPAGLIGRPPHQPSELPTVAVLVPARNEAATIAGCVNSIGRAAIVLDDGSVDGTASMVAAAGAEVIAGQPLPPGWLGKPWACAQLAATPAALAAQVLVFVDADVRLSPGAIDRAVGLLESSGLDVVCPFPRQLAAGVTERLLQPLLQWSWLTTLPLRVAEHSQRPTLTAACGQFLLIRRAALAAAGGFAAIRGDVLDDIALVRAVKAAGGRGGVVDGTDLAQCRMYHGISELRDGYGKSLWTAFGSPAGAGATVTTLVVAYVVPPVAALCGSRVGAVGYVAAVASRVVAARRTGGRTFPDSLAHPVSILTFAALVVDSLWQRRCGTLRWKDRVIAWD